MVGFISDLLSYFCVCVSMFMRYVYACLWGAEWTKIYTISLRIPRNEYGPGRAQESHELYYSAEFDEQKCFTDANNSITLLYSV